MYTEHEKLDIEKLKVIDDFFDWITSEGYLIVNTESSLEGRFMFPSWSNLRVQYFGADPANLEEERMQMLADLDND